MSKRHEMIGIKQAIRIEWLQKTTNLLLAGMDAKSIRNELHDYLSDRMGSGERKERSEEARSFAVGMLMRIWVTPDTELTQLRDDLIPFTSTDDSQSLVAHWAMLCSSYPFWAKVAKQTGRILALQERVTMKQVSSRVIEDYGDRQTVTRNAQFVVRSFSYWRILSDTETKGSYEKNKTITINDLFLTSLLFEALLSSKTEGKQALHSMYNDPALFPFGISMFSADSLIQKNKRLDVLRYGIDDEILKWTQTDISANR